MATFETWCWRRLLRVHWTARRSNPSILKEIILNIHWKDWCWCWNSNTLTTWCEELTHQNRPWWWERLKAEGEGDNRGWDGWMESPTRWSWVWVSSGSWKTRKPGVLPVHGVSKSWTWLSDWTEVNWLNLTKEEKRWRYHAFWFQTVLQSLLTTIVLYWHN